MTRVYMTIYMFLRISIFTHLGFKKRIGKSSKINKIYQKNGVFVQQFIFLGVSGYILDEDVDLIVSKIVQIILKVTKL